MKFYRIFKVSFLSKIQTRFINSDRNKFDRTKFKFNWRAEFLIFKFRYQFNSISGISCVVYGYLDWQLLLDTLKITFQSITNMNRSTFWRFKIYFNSQAVGLDSWVPSALKSIFRRFLFSNQLHDFSLLSLNTLLHSFLRFKFTKKISLTQTKISKAKN